MQHGAILPGDWVIPTAWWNHSSRFLFADDWKLKLRDDGVRTDSNGIDLTPDKWVVHIPQSIGGYPTQTGLFWAVAWPYLMKTWGEPWWMDGMEKFSWPAIKASTGQDTSKETREATQEALDRWTSGLSLIVTSETDVSYLETGAKDSGTWKSFVDAKNKDIRTAILGMTDASEPGRNGAFAAVEVRNNATVHPRMRLDALGLASTYKTQIFGPLRKYNSRFAGAQLPVITWNIASERSEIPAHLIAAGVVTVNELRASIGLPPVPGGERMTGEPAAAAVAPTPSPGAEPTPQPSAAAVAPPSTP